MIATDEDFLAGIQARTRTLGELLTRWSGQNGPPAADSGTTCRQLEAWQTAIANGDPLVLAKRLGWDGLDAESAASALGSGPAAGEPAAPWAETLRAAYGGSPAEVANAFARATGAVLHRPPGAASLPFEELFVPLVLLARERVSARAGDARALLEPPARATLEHALLERLTQISARALHGELAGFRAVRQQSGLGAFSGGASAGVFRSFIAGMQRGGFLRFLGTYPVAARLCGTVTELWVDATVEFLERLAGDAPELARTFGGGRALGGVAEIQAGLSDPHLGGRSVLVARFASGVRVVYKPRPIGIEQFFAECIDSVNRVGGMHRLRGLALVARPTHGWIEFAEHHDCEGHDAVARCFERCGMLLCLAYALGANDFHFENLITSGEHPVLIDLEALMSPRFALSESLATVAMQGEESNRRNTHSVLHTLLLPTLKPTHHGWAATDVGGLSRMDEPGEVEVWTWVDVNEDGMRLARSRTSCSTLQTNLPRLAGAQVPSAEHVDRLVAGFSHTYRLLLARRGEWLRAGGLLDAGRRHRVRFILRETALYATLLARCLHPRYLRSGIDRGIELDALTRALLRSDEKPAVWPAIRAEREALERMDIPCFDVEAGSTALELPTGEVIPGCFSASALDGARARLRGMDEADLNFQAAAIRTSFDALGVRGLSLPRRACSAPHATGAHQTEAPPGDVTEAAERLAGAVLARAQHSPSGELSWMAVTYLARARRHSVGAATLGLADGYAGPALFLAALAAHTGSERYRQAAAGALRPLCGRLDELERAARLRRSVDIGGGTGLGSAVYALTRIAGFLDDGGVLAAAHRAADCITAQAVDEDRSYDVVSGSAGALLGLLALHEASGREELLERAEACGRHLLANRTVDAETGAAVWATPHGAETGMAHGQAGIASALRRLAAVRPGSDLLQAAADAEAFELHRLGTGLEGTATANRAAAWSRGAAGIGLARLGGLRAGEDAPPEVEAAIRLTLDTLLEGSDDAACGVAGRVDFLLGAGLALRRPELVAAAREGAASLASAPDFRLVWRHGQFDAGFHLGLSGIGYQLLRTLDPARYPSVLLWR